MLYWNALFSLRRSTLWFAQCSADSRLCAHEFWLIKSSKRARNLFVLCKQCYLVLISSAHVNINLALTRAYPPLLSWRAHWFTGRVNAGCVQTNSSWSSLHRDEASFAITHQIPWQSASLLWFLFIFGGSTTLLVCFSAFCCNTLLLCQARERLDLIFFPLGSQQGWLQGIIQETSCHAFNLLDVI